MKKFLALIFVVFSSGFAFAQITLESSPYTQDFNSISSSLPPGFSVRAGATASGLGTAQALNTATLPWNNTTGGAKNFASATDLASTAATAVQNASTNRSLGFRQTAALGDPGAAFVLQLANTIGLNDFDLTFKLQSLDASSPRVAVWRVDYGFGPGPAAFTAAAASGTLTTGGAVFTDNTITVDFGNSLDNRTEDVWIRIVTLSATTGSGNRPSTAIDDFSLTFSSGPSTTPAFSAAPPAIAFGNQAIGTTGTTQSHTLTYANLDGSDVVVSTTSPFAISKSSSGPFGLDLTYAVAEFTGDPLIIYSQFSPFIAGLSNGTIVHTGGGVSGSATVSLTGTGVHLTPVAADDSFSGIFGNVITGDVSLNDNDPQSLVLTFAKLTDPTAGTLNFNADGTFSYESAEGSETTQTFSYRATNTLGLVDDAAVTITLAERSQVFISQYYEGTSVNKWIELTNPTSSPVNTASPQLKLALYSISGDAGNIVISGVPTQVVHLNVIIPAKSSVLIGNTGNGAEVPYLDASGAQQTSNSVVNFNGNDGVALLDATNNIQDAFGTGVNARDVSYVRNQDAVTPSATFIVADWTKTTLAIVQNAADLDDPDRLGVHVQPELPPCVAPLSQPSALSFTAVGTKTITLNFTASPDAGEYLVVRSLSNSLSETPADGIFYNPGNSLGGGTVAGRIAGTSFADNNLASGTTFYYFIYALNNLSCDSGPKYLLADPLTGSPATVPLPGCTAPLSQPTNFTVTFSNYNVIQGTFTPAPGVDEFLVVMSTDSVLTASPADQTQFSVGDSIGGGIVIRKGNQGSFNRSGLAQDTEYYFFIFSVNSNCTDGPLFLADSPLTGRRKTGILDSNALNFYFGNLHAHSSYSDGNKDDLTKKPEDDYAFAKNSLNMDFLGLSEHNHTQAGMRLAYWEPGRIAAANATTPDFIALHGMEWGVISGGGHVLVYGIDSLVGWEPGEHQIFVPKNTYTGPTGLFSIINRHGLNAIATLAHPNTADYNNIGANYDSLADNAIVGTALASGPAFSTNVTYSDPASSMNYLSYYNRMLARGYHLGASIDHDNHNMTFGRHTRARLVVLAPSLTENDLLDGMKRMRFYASEDSAARISYTIDGQPVGSVFSGNGLPQISVSGSTTSPVTSISIIYGTPGTGITPTVLATTSTSTLSSTDSTLTHLSTGYYYADITEADGSRIITSPIWYTRNDSIRTEQVITFNPIPTKTYGDADFDPAAASTNASIPIVYFSSDGTVAAVVNNKIQIRSAGTVTITAYQPGNALFKPAISKTQLLTIVLPLNLKIQYRNADGSLTNNEGKPHLKIVNGGGAAVPYSQLTARYWITPENFTGSMGMWIDYAVLGNSKVIMKYIPLGDPRINALGYIEYSFTVAAGSLPAGGNSGEIQSRYANTDWSAFNEANDHSIGTNSTYTDKSSITLYRNGVLMWGTEPAAAAPARSFTVFSETKGSATSNTISTFVDLRNEGNVPVDYNDITARYWFTSDGASPLKFWVDYAKIGNSAVTGSFVAVSPLRPDANVYMEMKVKPPASTFYPLTSTGNVQYRITKTDWSNFNLLNDYSYKAGGMSENSKITLYYQGELVYGTEPAGGGARISADALAEDTGGVGSSDQIVVHPNPSKGKFTLLLNDQSTGPFKAILYNSAGQTIDAYSGERNGSFRREYDLKLPGGIYLIRIIGKEFIGQRKVMVD